MANDNFSDQRIFSNCSKGHFFSTTRSRLCSGHVNFVDAFASVCIVPSDSSTIRGSSPDDGCRSYGLIQKPVTVHMVELEESVGRREIMMVLRRDSAISSRLPRERQDEVRT